MEKVVSRRPARKAAGIAKKRFLVARSARGVGQMVSVKGVDSTIPGRR